MKKTTTSRGFRLNKFLDSNGVECSLQESSLGTERAIWFGVSDANPTLKGSPVDLSGLLNFDTRVVLINTRMHLSKKLTKKLLKCFKIFLNGKIFEAFEFVDRYNCKCSMKISDELIEIGPDDPNPQYLHQGWKPLHYPDETKFTTHMFLNKELVDQLTSYLEYFVETGELR